MDIYTVIVNGVKQRVTISPEEYDGFIAEYPDAILEEKETEDFQTDIAADVDVVSEKVTLDTDSASENGSLESASLKNKSNIDEKLILDVFNDNDWETVKESIKVFNDDPNIEITSEKKNIRFSKGSDNLQLDSIISLTYTDPETDKKEVVKIDSTFSSDKSAKAVSSFLSKYTSKEFAKDLKLKAEEQETLLSAPGKPLYVSPQEAEESVGLREDVFAPVTKTIAVQEEMDGKMIGVGQEYEETTIPYEKEINDIKAEISNERSENNQISLTDKDITEKAESVMYANLVANKKAELLTDKVTNYIEENPKEAGKFLLKGAIKKNEKANQFAKEVAVFTSTLEGQAKNNQQIIAANNYLQGNVIGSKPIILNGIEITLGDTSDGSSILKSKSGNLITQDQLNLLNLSIENGGATEKEIDAQRKKLNSTATKLGDLKVQMKAAGLEYSLTEKYLTTATVGLASIAAGAVYYGAKLANYGLYGATFGLNDEAFDKTNDWLNTKGSEWLNFKNDLRSNYLRDVTLAEGFNGKPGNFGKFVAQEMSSQAPILIAMAASGGTAAPYLIGAYTAGEKMMEMAYDDNLTGNKTSEFEMFAKGTGVGLANGVFTGLTSSPILQRGINAFKANKLGGEYLLGVKDYFKNNWKQALIYDNALELSGELATNIVENAIEGNGYFDNAAHVAVSSAGFSFAFSTLPFFKGLAVRQYMSSETMRSIDARQQKIFDLNKDYNIAKNKDSNSAKLLGETLDRLKKEQNEEINSVSKNALNGIDSAGALMFTNASKLVSDGKRQASEIVNDKNLSYATKQIQLESLAEAFEQAKLSRDLYLSKEAFGDNFVLLESYDKVKYNKYILDAQKKLGKDTVSKNVKDEASDLYRADVIREQNANLLKSNKNYKLVETKEEAIALLNELDISAEEKAEIIENIKDGAGGVNVADNNGNMTPIAIVESQVEQSKEAVGTHEVSHAGLTSLFKSQPEKMMQMKNQVEAWLTNASPALQQKIQLNLKAYKDKSSTIIAEEYLANFFEIVAEGRIKLDSEENSSFAGLAAYMTQDIAGSGYDFQFKGVNDFAAFAVSIGNGIKNGTIDFGNVEKQFKTIKDLKVEIPLDTENKDSSFSLALQLNKFETALEKIEEDYDNNVLDYDDYEQKRDLQEERIAAVKKKIESIGESEVVSKPKKKKEQTTSQKEQNAKVNALVGEKDAEGNYISTKKEWLKDGVGRAYNAIVKGNLIDGLIVKGIVGDTIQGKSVEEFVQDVKESLTPLLMRFNPEINNSLIGFINSQLFFRKGDALIKLRKGKTENIDSGTKEMNAIEAKADKSSNETKQEPVGNLLKATSLISQVTRNKLAEGLKKWAKDNNIDFDNFRFSMVDTTLAITDELGNPMFQDLKGKQVINSLLDDAMREIFPNVSPDKILDTRKMFTGKEATAMHKAFLADVVDADSVINSNDTDSLAGIFIKILPKGAIAADGKNKTTAKDINTNRATALDPSILQNFYVKSGKAIGKTGLQEYVLKDNIRYSDVYAAFGMDSAGNKTTYNRSGNTRSVLAASGRLLGQLMMNEVIRTDLGLTAEQQLNTAAGKSDAMFAKKMVTSLEAINVDVNVKLTEDNIARTRKLFVDLAQELGPEDTIKYLVPLISRGYGRWMTKLGLKYFIPGRFSLFKNREDFFKTIGMEEFKNFKPGDRTVSIMVINKEGKSTLEDVNLKIDFDQSAKKLDKLVDSIKDRQEFAKDQQKGLLKISQFLMDSLKKDKSKQNMNAVATFLQSMNSNVNGLIRTAAVPKYMFLVTGNVDYVYEHSKTASDTLVELAALIFSKDKNKLNKEFNNVMEDFVVSIIPKKYDVLLGEVSRANGPKEGGNRKDYTKSLIRPKNGIPARYAMPAFINKLIKNGLSPMNLVEINSNSLKNHLSAVKTDKKIIKENNANLSKSIRQKDQSMNEVMESMIASDKTLTIANSLNVPSKGISVWDFDDTLAKSKSNVLYTMPGDIITNEKDFYNEFIAAHKDLRSKNKNQTKKLILKNGFDQSNNVNALPIFKGYDKSTDVISTRYQKYKKGDIVYLLNSEGITEGANGYKVKKGYKPKASEIITITKDGQNVFEAWSEQNFPKKKLTAEQFAKEGDRLMAEGAEFDFSEFSKVVQGSKGPFFEKAMARNKKFGNENVYILTARPANSASAIHEFLKGIGLDIPLANITGLANSSPQAKANWVVSKAAEGYNDFYFADDAKGNVKAVDKALGKIDVKKKVELAEPSDTMYSLKNQPKAVQDVLNVIDVKGQVQQNRLKTSEELNDAFNDYLEGSTGIEAYKRYKKDKAMLKGKGKGRFDYLIPPGAEDFVGLLYKTLQKGKKGEQQFAFYKKYLIDPYMKAMSELIKARTAIGKDFIALKKELGIIPKSLKKTFKVKDENGKMKDSLFTVEQAVRTYVWNAQGIEMPNLSQVDLALLVNHINADPKLKLFADKILSFNKGVDSKPPSIGWLAGSIATDLQANLNSVGRKQLLEVWTQNKDAIFSEENLNKLEAAYGADYVDAVRDILRRMTTGRSTLPASGNKDWDKIVKWLNAAVGNIMSFNIRSASLQLLSITNFIDMEDNNIITAGKAFANQKQYWKDTIMLLNSDYLVDRRDGTRINVNEADIALAAKEGGAQGVLNKILEVGFLPTKIADSFAIAVGGSTYYRTKVNALIKKGMNKTAAEKQAMLDFIARSEESQQSSEQSKISRQQAGSVGKLILAFGNTSAQYARIIKKSALDLKNGRGNPATHIARITYYGAIQNFVFNFLQQALFKLSFGDEEEEEESDAKKVKMANSMVDSLLRGMGWQAAALAAIKNTAFKLYERNDKKVNNDFGDKAVATLLTISPPLSSKISKIARVGNIYEWEMKKKKRSMFDDPFSLDSPQLAMGATLIAAATSLPTDRALSKAINIVDVFKEDTENWQRPWIAAGWPKWSLQTDAQNAEDRKKTGKAKVSPRKARIIDLRAKGEKAQDSMLKSYGFTKMEIRILNSESYKINAIIKFQDEVVKK